MIPRGARAVPTRRCFPLVSGDEPVDADFAACSATFSLRERGWAGLAELGARRRRVFPA